MVVRAFAIGGHLDLHLANLAAELIPLLGPHDTYPSLLSRLGHALCDFIDGKPLLDSSFT
jgi:hypothetical protein